MSCTRVLVYYWVLIYFGLWSCEIWLFAFSVIVSGCSVSQYCVLGTLFLCVLSPGSPLLNCITVINMSFGFYSCYIFVNSVSPYSISNSSPFIVCKSDSTSVRGLWVLSIFYFINFWWCVIFKLKSLSEIALVLVHSRTRCF